MTEQQQQKGQNQQLRVDPHRGLARQRLRNPTDARVLNPGELLSSLNKVELSELRTALFKTSNSLDNKAITLSPLCLAETQATIGWVQIKHELCLLLVMLLYKYKYILLYAAHIFSISSSSKLTVNHLDKKYALALAERTCVCGGKGTS